MSLLSKEDHALLMESAFQVVDASLNADALFREACCLAKRSKVNGGDLLWSTAVNENQNRVQDFLMVSCCDTQCDDGTVSSSLYTTPAIALQVVDTVRKNPAVGPLLSDLAVENFSLCLQLAETSTQQNMFVPSLFASLVARHVLPLEVLWGLHKNDIMDFASCLDRKLGEATFSNKLSEDIVSLCVGPSQNLSRRQDVLSGMMTHLVTKAFSTDITGHSTSKRTFITILDGILKGLVELPPPDTDTELAKPVDTALLAKALPQEIVKKFCFHALSVVISTSSDTTVEEALKCPDQWKTVKMNGPMRTLVKQLLLPLDHQEALSVLQRAFDQCSIKLVSLCNFLDLFFLQFVDSRNSFSDYVRKVLTDGISESDIQKLSTAFLLVRLSSSIAAHTFPSYQDWYQKTFGDSSTSPVTSRPAFSFLIKFLSILVPTEIPETLRTHIFRRPFMPPKCKKLYEEYVALAKTRLVDMKEAVTESGSSIYIEAEQMPSHSKKKVDTADQDVDKAIESFTISGKIPTVVLEASIFKKPYFVSRFLPALLKPRYLPDEPDERMRLIEEVRKSGRIPNTLYSSYLEACQREKQNLLEGVFDVDEDLEDDLELPPEEQLDLQLERLSGVIIQGRKDAAAEALCTVKDRVESVLASSTKVCQHAGVSLDLVVDVKKPTHSCVHSKVVEKFLMFVSGVVVSLEKREESSALYESRKQVERLVSILASLPGMQSCLLTVVLTTLSTKHVMKGVSLNALAVTVACFVALPALSVEVRGLQTQPDLVTPGTDVLGAALFCLECTCGWGMVQNLRFFLAYLKWTLSSLDWNEREINQSEVMEIDPSSSNTTRLLPSVLILRVLLLCQRFGVCQGRGEVPVHTRATQIFPEAEYILSSESWKRCSQSYQVELKYWLQFELAVDPHRDELSATQRATYHLGTVFNFLKSSELRETDKFDSLARICSEIFQCLVETKQMKSSAADEFGHDSAEDFLHLLRRLVGQLPPSQTKSSWLSQQLSPPVRSEKAFRLALQLQPHLVFCNSPKSEVTAENLKCALQIVQLFSSSCFNEGGYLALDCTLHLLQGFCNSSVLCLPASVLQRFLYHPLIMSSVMVHSTCLALCDAVDGACHDLFSPLLLALDWAERCIADPDQQKSHPPLPPSSGNDRIQASAVFAVFIKRKDSSLYNLSQFFEKLNHKVVLLFMEFLLAWTSVITVDTRDKFGAVELLKHLLERQPKALEDILSSSREEQLTTFRESLGICMDGATGFFRLKQIFRTSSEMKGPLSASSFLPVLVKSYCDLRSQFMKSAECSSQDFCDDLTGIASWLHRVIDCSNNEQLKDVNLVKLQGADPLLYSRIQQRRKSS